MEVLDTSALAAWLRRENFDASGDVVIRPLGGGQSNPTYHIRSGDWQGVLRTKPIGPLLPSAHAIDREYRVMQALRASEVPVPQMLAYCSDTAVIGREFFLMEFVKGRVFMDQALPGCSLQERVAMYDDMNHVIANLHAVNYRSVGLSTFGKSGSYFERQIARWSRQCRDSGLAVPPALLDLMAWLPEHIPPGDETTLVHGDFRLDNLIFHPTNPEVLAVLDWELSTLGHPLADFAYHCMSWRIPASLWRGVGGLDLKALGIPTEDEYVRRYVERTGREPAENWNFYMAYNLFRMAAILHGIAARAAAGTAAAANAVETGLKAEPLAQIGWECAQLHANARI